MIRPFVMEPVTLAGARDTVAEKLAVSQFKLDSGEKMQYGGKLSLWPADDIFTYVVDAGADIAPFAKNSLIEQLPEAQRHNPKSLRGDRSPWNLTNGYTSADAWYLAYMFDPQDKTQNNWTLTWPTAQTLARLVILPNVTNRKPSRIKVTFDGASDPLMVQLKPENTRQTFDLGGRKAKSLTMEVAECLAADDPKNPSLTGIDNLWIEAVRPPAFTQAVHPLLNVGGIVSYPMGKGQLILLQLNVPAQETNPANTAKKVAIVRALLDGLGVEMVPPANQATAQQQ